MEPILIRPAGNLNPHLPVRGVSDSAASCKGNSYFNDLAACEYLTTKQDADQVNLLATCPVFLYAYIKDVLTRLPTQRNSQIAELLPDRW